jgi:hypothetical protein
VSHIAAVSPSSLSRLQTTHGATAPASKGHDSKPAPVADPAPAAPAAPASSHAPAPQALNANAMSVLIDVQAGLEKLAGNAAHAIGEVIDHFHDHHHHQAPQPQPAPAPKPVVIPGGDTAAATLSSAAIAARLLDEGGMLQAAAQRSASWAQQRASRQVADANTGITLLKATLSGYQAWQSDFAAPNGGQVSLDA